MAGILQRLWLRIFPAAKLIMTACNKKRKPKIDAIRTLEPGEGI